MINKGKERDTMYTRNSTTVKQLQFHNKNNRYSRGHKPISTTRYLKLQNKFVYITHTHTVL